MTLTLGRLLALAVLAVPALTGCAGGDDSGADLAGVEGGKIALLLPEASGRWEANDRRSFEQAFSKAGVDYIVSNAEGDASQQQIQADQALANGAKVLVLVNLGPTSGAAIVEKAHAQGAVVIDYDRLTAGGEGADFHVAYDEEEAGRLLGEGLAGCLDASGVATPRVAVLTGGSDAVTAGFGAVVEPRFESGDWSRVGEAPLAPGALERQEGGVDGVLATTDESAGAAIAALGKPAAVTGGGATVEGIQRVLSGEQCLTVYRSIPEEAAAAADLAVSLVKGNEPKLEDRVEVGEGEVPALLLPPVSVTKDNVADTVVADGYRTWDEICVGEVARFCPPPGRR